MVLLQKLRETIGRGDGRNGRLASAVNDFSKHGGSLVLKRILRCVNYLLTESDRLAGQTSVGSVRVVSIDVTSVSNMSNRFRFNVVEVEVRVIRMLTGMLTGMLVGMLVGMLTRMFTDVLVDMLIEMMINMLVGMLVGMLNKMLTEMLVKMLIEMLSEMLVL